MPRHPSIVRAQQCGMPTLERYSTSDEAWMRMKRGVISSPNACALARTSIVRPPPFSATHTSACSVAYAHELQAKNQADAEKAKAEEDAEEERLSTEFIARLQNEDAAAHAAASAQKDHDQPVSVRATRGAAAAAAAVEDAPHSGKARRTARHSSPEAGAPAAAAVAPCHDKTLQTSHASPTPPSDGTVGALDSSRLGTLCAPRQRPPDDSLAGRAGPAQAATARPSAATSAVHVAPALPAETLPAADGSPAAAAAATLVTPAPEVVNDADLDSSSDESIEVICLDSSDDEG